MPDDVSPVQSQTSTFDKVSSRSFLIIWIIAILIGVGLALTRVPSVFVDGDVHPLGHDAFYHATRILEIAEDPSSTHSFDQNLHWPEGHWIAWPWAYDYLVGVTAGAFSSDRIGAARIMAYYPLFWLICSISLVGLIAREVLRPGLAAICMFAYAAHPLTLTLFSVGSLDHHSAEHFWILLSVYLTGMWLKSPESSRIAVALGVALAAATAFHNILFLLQVPVLAALFVTRLSGYTLPSRRQSMLFGISLCITQLLVLLPSHHFLTFEYEFFLQSWFQLHAAFLTAIGVAALCSKQKLIMVVLLCVAVLLALPTVMQVMFGVNYLQSDLYMFDKLQETQPMYGGSLSAFQISFFYTGLLWLLPVYVGFAFFQIVKRRAKDMTLMIMLTALFGFAMMIVQFRFQYFGLFFLVIMPMLVVQSLLPKGRDVLIAGSIIIGAYAWSLSYYLLPPKPGDSVRYNFGLPIIKAAKAQCEKQPGLLLADRNWGNYLLYQTECPIFSNNFILTPKEVNYVKMTSELLQLTPEQLRISAPDVRYVLVNDMDMNPLTGSLLSDESFDGFNILGELHDGSGKIRGRLYQVDSLTKAPLIDE